MPFQRPTLVELINRAFADIVGRLNLQGALLRRSVVGVLARVLAGASHMLHGHLEWIAKMSMPDTAEGVWLRRWAAIWKIYPDEATFATGSITITGTLDGAAIPAATVVKRSDGVQFQTLADAVIASGTATVEVEALEAGSLANTDAAVTLSLLFPIAGVNSAVVVAAGGIDSGTDAQTDESLKQEMLARIAQPPHGGAKFDYETWAKEVPGVTRAWVYPLHMGPNTVGVTFVRDNDVSIIPSAGQVEDMQEYIDERRPVTAEVIVFAPVADTQNFTIEINPSTIAVKNAIEAELKDFLRREAEPGGTLYLSRINEAISIAAGEFDHVLTAPSADVVSAAGHIPVFGTITWA